MQDYLDNTDYLHIALGNTKTMVVAMKERFRDDTIVYIQAPGKTFRYGVATLEPYKGKREGQPKPQYYHEITAYLQDRWDAQLVDHIETDDRMAIHQYTAKERNTVLCTIDKDLLQGVPGWNWNWNKAELEYTPIEKANLFHFYQMLVGDAVDSIPGIKGVGDKTALKIIEANGNDLDRVRAAVQEQYKKQYGDMWEQAYKEVSRLLYILRKEDELDTGCPFLYG